jgi:hypothetical protein
MKKTLQEYTNGKINFTPIMNILMGNRDKDWYAELGKYITETIDITKVPELSFLSDRLEQNKNLVTKMKDWLGNPNTFYFSVSSFFLTSGLNEDVLRKMFGEPILHDEFGEGFDGEYDEETDEYGDPDIKESYASYFVNIGGTRFHIGYDHRGTGIEVEISKKFIFGQASKEEASKCLDSLKKLVDLYKEKIL